jgi:pimeloyl-ACP methyl ester carboxylesterase
MPPLPPAPPTGPGPAPAVIDEGRRLTEWPGVFVTDDAQLRLPCLWGRLVVPTRRDRSDDGTRLEIAHVRLRCRRTPVAAPIVVLAGGPGGSGVGDLQREREVLEALLEVGDVIGLDQRGVGLSQPRLSAPGTQTLSLHVPLDREAVIATYRRHAAVVRAGWAEQGVDLAAYNTRESAADIDDLRRALGLEKICLIGESYGSHLGLAVLRAHGDGVERAVLGLVEGPDDTLKRPSNVDRFFEQVSAQLQAEGWGGGRLPPLTNLMRELHLRLRRAPAALPQGVPGLHCRWLSETTLQYLAGNALGHTSALQALPALYAQLWQGRHEAVLPLLRGWAGVVDDDAMSMAMDSASSGSAVRRAQVEAERHDALLGDTMNLPYPHIADEIGALDLGDEYRAPLHSTVPTLLISGDLDGRTPESNARAVQAGLPNATHLLLRGCGHHLQAATGYLADVQAFLRGEDVVDRGDRGVPVRFEAAAD